MFAASGFSGAAAGLPGLRKGRAQKLPSPAHFSRTLTVQPTVQRRRQRSLESALPYFALLCDAVRARARALTHFSSSRQTRALSLTARVSLLTPSPLLALRLSPPLFLNLATCVSNEY